MLDLRRLTLLREVHLRGSISAAASALSYSHSAVSQQLSLLEKEAGVVLLDRVGRGVRLTSAAEELVRRTDEVMMILEKAESELASNLVTVRGMLRIAAFTTISRHVIPRLVGSLAQRYPELDVRYRQVEPETGLELLSSRHIDVLVTDGYPVSEGRSAADLHAEVLMHDPIRVYPPAGVVVTNLDDLRGVRWVLEPPGSEARAWAQSFCASNGLEPMVAYESADLLFHVKLVQAGVAAALLPDLVVRDVLDAPTPTTVLGSHQTRRISFMCRVAARQRPSIVACRDAFIEHLGQRENG